MSKIAMFYREVAPAEEISHLVLSFWEFTARGEMSEPIVHEVFPDGCISLFYYRNETARTGLIFIKDLSLETAKTPIYAGDLYWGMRFSPAACVKIARCSPSEIYSRPLNGTEEFPHLTAGLSEKLDGCQNFAEAVEVFGKTVESLKINAAETDEKVAAAIKIIEENRGEIKIAELAKAINLSVRQLERRFRKNAGLSPKQFARARRMRATAINLVEEDQMNWANRAAEMGFTDQSHLTREFSNLTGRSPNSFAERVKRIEHGELVK